MNLPTRVLLLLGLAFSLIGCASGPEFASYSARLRPPAPGEGRIWFYRPTKFSGAAVQPAVYLNKEKVGSAQPGCFFFVDRKPGIYEAKCTTEWVNREPIVLAANEEKFVRLAIRMGLFIGHIAPTVVDRATGLKEIAHCKLISAGGGNADATTR